MGTPGTVLCTCTLCIEDWGLRARFHHCLTEALEGWAGSRHAGVGGGSGNGDPGATWGNSGVNSRPRANLPQLCQLNLPRLLLVVTFPIHQLQNAGPAPQVWTARVTTKLGFTTHVQTATAAQLSIPSSHTSMRRHLQPGLRHRFETHSPVPRLRIFQMTLSHISDWQARWACLAVCGTWQGAGEPPPPIQPLPTAAEPFCAVNSL